MYQSSFFIVGKHAVIEALKNPNRKVLRLFLTEESKKSSLVAKILKFEREVNLLLFGFYGKKRNVSENYRLWRGMK